jgi:hypothetical protein
MDKLTCKHVRWTAISLSYVYCVNHAIDIQIHGFPIGALSKWVKIFEDLSRSRAYSTGISRHFHQCSRHTLRITFNSTLAFIQKTCQEQMKVRFPKFSAHPLQNSSLYLNITRKVLNGASSATEIQDFYCLSFLS